MIDLSTFSSNYFAPALIIFSQFGTIFGLIVISKKKLIKIGPQIIYIALFIYDWILFLTILQPYIQLAYNIDFSIFSRLVCKLYNFIGYAFGPISPMLNVYISIERFISIAYPTKKYILLKKENQLACIFTLTLHNLLLYVPIGIYFDLNTLENQTICYYIDEYWQNTYSYIDLTNRVIIPFVLMSIFSILIIHTIFTSRSRISSNARADRTFRKDIRFSLLIILLNIFYLLFSLPISILIIFPDYFMTNQFFIFFSFVYYMAYSSNFYLIFSANSLFRKGFYSIFVCSKPRVRANHNVPRNASRIKNLTKEIIREEFQLENLVIFLTFYNLLLV
jgi:hypothetical protein